MRAIASRFCNLQKKPAFFLAMIAFLKLWALYSVSFGTDKKPNLRELESQWLHINTLLCMETVLIYMCSISNL